MKTKFIESIKEASNAKSFYFELPNSSFTWTPGQYTSLSFEENNDSNDNLHWFTIASDQRSGKVQITTRISGSSYKNRLDSLRAGDEVYLSSPEGDFIWEETTKDIVFIAGGIGITPFHSMLVSNSQLKAHLIYVNRSEDFIFKKELDRIKNSNQNIKISYLIGAVEKEILEKAEPNLYDSLVYLSGPEPMVESIGNKLIESGLSENNLKRDWFPGYDNSSF